MLGRNSYTQEELDHARAAVGRQLKAYKKLAKAADGVAPAVASALTALEPQLFNNLLLALDRRFVHRVRGFTGKDTNPLNEVELIADSLMNNDGVLLGNTVIRFIPERTVLEVELGDRIALTAARFERLATAFLAEIETRSS